MGAGPPGARDSLEARFGARLVQLRRAAGLSQAQLAERANLSVVHLSDLERGRKGPMFPTLQALAEALDVPVLELFRFEGEPERPRRGRPPKATRPTPPP